MSAAELIEPIGAQGGALSLPDAADWLQGRTLYGGATALIAYTAAIRAFPDLPPLRAAQIAFVAPAGPEMELRRDIVRQGRNVVQVRSEIWCEGRCALTAFWLFGTARDGNASHEAARLTPFPAPATDSEPMMTGKGPAFIQNNFELRRAQDTSGPGEPVVRRWARLTDHGALDPVSELILLGDVLPPGAMRAMQRPGPISSINWSFNLIDTAPATQDGWWLAENACQQASGGYSAERLRLWNADGAQMLDGQQCVAIFG
ncbi:acyl-CoA thioesterase [Qipengyuania marisflavi]|uniref:Thioesterase family protein n=1 Tax=Qipengyuania marisflavi TaxID=2486356 RepID=A0A5S3P2K7_9SPHN|nr:thioesterase family protein [Qipengyuania marisflavi]TMM46163.1 thioesterase family protein [Qipengyuania marisflavi]